MSTDMPTKIIYGKCSPSTLLLIFEHFLANRCQNSIRVAIPLKYQTSETIPFWICHAKLPNNNYLVQHPQLKHLDFGTYDELLDRGITLEEILTDDT